jgi:hypothetical protein
MSVLQDPHGPDWPLGFIKVLAPGTPVSIMSLVDPAGVNAPGAATSATSDEYSRRCQQIMFQGWQPDTHGMKLNTKNVYIMRAGANYDDPGAMVAVLAPGQTLFLASAPVVVDVFSPYQFFLDADVKDEGALVTLFIF